MKRLLVILLSLITVLTQAQVRIGEREAYTTVEQFLSQQGKSNLPTISEEIKSQTSGQTNLFVFSLEPQGFVIVSAIGEVLAYSFESGLPHSEKLPEHIAYWIELYNQQTDVLLEQPEQARKPSKGPRSVEPLLTSAWGQGCYYNATCPYDNEGQCQHALAGCVAVSMAQIMYYYKQPIMGNGSLSYSCWPYGMLGANFGQTYHWDEMADQLQEPNDAVAGLIYHCGVSVRTRYNATLSLANFHDAIDAFHYYFSYPYATICYRSDYNDEAWLNMLMDNLDKHHPVFYTGFSSRSGHSFVCDGYDNNGMFHFNFGWGGDANGYFTIDDISGYSNVQSIIKDIYPVIELPINSDEHGIIYVSPDGTGDGSSWQHATQNLQWAIFKAYLNNSSIWVKEGCYTGDTINGDAFLIYRKCKLYGGFKGDEPYDYDLAQRNIEAHPSILDGNQIQRVIHEQTISQYDTVIIDGFTIQNGNATQGGGLLLSNKTMVRNCKICRNNATIRGGGFYSIGEEQTFWNCLISNNTSRTGGGCALGYGNHLYNCTIVKNEAEGNYGGVDNSQSPESNTIQNCIIWGNVSAGPDAQIGPSDYYSYCAVQDDTSETGNNFVADAANDGELPHWYIRFVNANVTPGTAGQGGDWRLQPNSLCINRGKLNTGKPPTDLAGNPRLMHGDLDLGAYESNVATQVIDTYYCEDDPYFYQDSLLSAIGLYTFLNQTGPNDSLLVIHLQEPSTDIVVLNEEICPNETYDFFGTPLNMPGVYTTTHKCTSYRLYLTVKPATTLLSEKTICEGDTCYFFGMPLLESGHYSTMVDCNTYELDLTVYPVSDVPVYLSEEICYGDYYDFLGRYLFYTGHYSGTLNCTDYELDLNVKPSPSLSCTSDTLVEYGNVIQLTASGADTYLWSTGDTSESISVQATIDMTYTVTGYYNNGCSATKSVTVSVNNQPEEIILYPNPTDGKVTVYMPMIDEVEVFNFLGEQRAQVKANRQPVELDVSSYPSGVYIVHVRELNKHYYTKLIVRH